MIDVHVGCCSWTSPAWSGRFYPPTVRNGDRLAYYARRFDVVEIDATYYRPPTEALVRRWEGVTPPGFRFALKAPRDLVDLSRPIDADGIDRFVRTARRLGGKLGPILLQFSPSVTARSAARTFLELCRALPGGVRYSVELRSPDWFSGDAWRTLASELTDRGMALTWSFLTAVDVPTEVTSDFLYVRLIGDHVTVPASQHGERRIDRGSTIQRYADRLRTVRAPVAEAFVFVNNHFEGFAPDSANRFREAIGKAPAGAASGGSLDRYGRFDDRALGT